MIPFRNESANTKNHDHTQLVFIAVLQNSTKNLHSLLDKPHIFEKQVYGLAPTEIIYRIAINFILGFADETDTFKHNFRQADTLPAAKEGTLQALLNELYS